MNIIQHTDLKQLPNAELAMYLIFEYAYSQCFFEDLYHNIPWQQDPITVFGKTYPQPRLTSLHANTSIHTPIRGNNDAKADDRNTKTD